MSGRPCLFQSSTSRLLEGLQCVSKVRGSTNGAASSARTRDVKEGDLVSALCKIPPSQLHRLAQVAHLQ
jgi:hypothetical protein